MFYRANEKARNKTKMQKHTHRDRERGKGSPAVKRDFRGVPTKRSGYMLILI